jgi:adenylate cyclase
VFVGGTALGTRGIVATPFDTSFAGVEVQATVADNLLAQDFLRRPEHGVALEAQTTMALGIVLALLVGRAGLRWGSLAGLVCLGLLWSGAPWLVSTTGAFLSPLFPTIGLFSALMAMTVAKFAAERHRAELAGEANALSQQLMVQSLLSLTEVRDGETGRHSRRTERYARLLAERLSAHPGFHEYLTPERIDLLARLAPLHDIGKVGVPDHVLNKPGKLTRDEFAEMKKHPTYGRDVLLRAERRAGSHDDAVVAMAKDIVYTHHERWDGTGYPQGLGGAQIPIPGRLIAIVDTYDALTSRRVYREGMSQDEAIALILEARGTHFDPAVVDAFYQVVPILRNMSNELEIN